MSRFNNMKKFLSKCCQPRFLIGGGVILFCLILPFLLDRPDERYTQIRSFPMMGTVGRITIYSDRADLPEQALNQSQKTIAEIEKTCNIFDPESELSRLNHTAYEQDFVCSPLLWEMLCRADHYYKISDGAFDVTVQPLMRLWGFRQKRKVLPSPQEISQVMKTVGWNKVKLDPEKRTVRFTVKGMEIDFGGIAKGFALEKVLNGFRQLGVSRAVLDLGGNIGCIAGENKDAFRIGIRDPQSPAEVIETLPLRRHCIATSGGYERFVIIAGKEYAHIMDPRTGMPVSGILSVTVVTPNGTDSDALSTAVFVAGEKLAAEICRKIPDTGIVIVCPDKAGRRILRFGSFPH